MKLSTYSAITAAVLSATSLNAFAGDVNLYGKANVSLQSSDEGEGSFTEVKSNASRLGFKGTQELSEGLSVVFKAEFQIDLDGDSDKGDSITDRNQYVGLKGNFGTVLLGKNDTMLKLSQGKADLFSDYNGDIKNLWEGENRVSDSVIYFSPKYNGFQLGVTYIAEDEKDGDDGISTAIFYGDKGLKKSDYFASVAYDSEVDGHDTMRATVSGKFDALTLSAIYHSEENVDGGGELDGFMVSAKYKLDNVTLKGQVQTANADGGDDTSSYTVGADYSLAKSTKLYAFYTSFDMDSAEDESYLATGIEFKF